MHRIGSSGHEGSSPLIQLQAQRNGLPLTARNLGPLLRDQDGIQALRDICNPDLYDTVPLQSSLLDTEETNPVHEPTLASAAMVVVSRAGGNDALRTLVAPPLGVSPPSSLLGLLIQVPVPVIEEKWELPDHCKETALSRELRGANVSVAAGMARVTDGQWEEHQIYVPRTYWDSSPPVPADLASGYPSEDPRRLAALHRASVIFGHNALHEAVDLAIRLRSGN